MTMVQDELTKTLKKKSEQTEPEIVEMKILSPMLANFVQHKDKPLRRKESLDGGPPMITHGKRNFGITKSTPNAMITLPRVTKTKYVEPAVKDDSSIGVKVNNNNNNDEQVKYNNSVDEALHLCRGLVNDSPPSKSPIRRTDSLASEASVLCKGLVHDIVEVTPPPSSPPRKPEIALKSPIYKTEMKINPITPMSPSQSPSPPPPTTPNGRIQSPTHVTDQYVHLNKNLTLKRPKDKPPQNLKISHGKPNFIKSPSRTNGCVTTSSSTMVGKANIHIEVAPSSPSQSQSSSPPQSPQQSQLKTTEIPASPMINVSDVINQFNRADSIDSCISSNSSTPYSSSSASSVNGDSGPSATATINKFNCDSAAANSIVEKSRSTTLKKNKVKLNEILLPHLIPVSPVDQNTSSTVKLIKSESNEPNYEKRGISSFSKDLSSASNRYPDAVQIITPVTRSATQDLVIDDMRLKDITFVIDRNDITIDLKISGKIDKQN